MNRFREKWTKQSYNWSQINLLWEDWMKSISFLFILHHTELFHFVSLIMQWYVTGSNEVPYALWIIRLVPFVLLTPNQDLTSTKRTHSISWTLALQLQIWSERGETRPSQMTRKMLKCNVIINLIKVLFYFILLFSLFIQLFIVIFFTTMRNSKFLVTHRYARYLTVYLKHFLIWTSLCYVHIISGCLQWMKEETLSY